MRAAKTLVAAIGTVITALTTAYADDVLSVEEVGTVVSVVIVGIASVYAVWRVPNKPSPDDSLSFEHLSSDGR